MSRSIVIRGFLVACLVGVAGCSEKKADKGGNKQGFEGKALDNPPPPTGSSTPDPNAKGFAPGTKKAPANAAPGGGAGVN